LAFQEPLAFGLDALGLASFERCQGFVYLLLQNRVHEWPGLLLLLKAAALAAGELGALEADGSHGRNSKRTK
ncbi:MAG: hypothetical protein K0M52_19535, partial [Pseudomonas sp.]|nr:hypothetical protein [Pseudomonas sp.]